MSSSSSSTWTPAYNPDQLALYFVIGLATTSLPAYLYHGVYGVSVTSFAVVYIAVILVSSALLTLAYKQAENNAHLALAAARATPSTGKKSGAPKGGALLQSQEAVTTLEAQAWSVFVVNALYSGVFLFLAFYVLKAIDAPYDLAISSVIASVAAWQIAAAITKG